MNEINSEGRWSESKIYTQETKLLDSGYFDDFNCSDIPLQIKIINVVFKEQRKHSLEDGADYTQRANGDKMTSYRRRCAVVTSHRR